ncbi:MAG: alpha-L-fucosidase [Chitinophagaceae bacterium]|nr:MAG: alpha-L-fucosidase [Chitinophagaceae bacterium]
MPIKLHKKILILFSFLLIGYTDSFCQNHALHPQSTQYEWPKDPLVKQKLEQWQDQKFGMIIHWGLYAVPGIVESWTLCSEDWINRDTSFTKDYATYKNWYWSLQKQFNPQLFNPEQWADAANNAGMKYLVFTTKHHDGFNMFDTKESDFKITNGPFAKHPKANVAKYVFDAFRKKGMMIGAYYSKPDWHNQDYWWNYYATPNRNNNYDIKKYPEKWNRYKNFTFNQIQELMTDYGTMDILWLDGGWVRPKETINDEVLSWGAPIPEWSQDINMPKIAEMARKNQPGILMVDRTVHGPYENYQTPEQKIPNKKLDYPWESCMTLGTDWGYVKNQKLKSAATVIHSLVEIVAKGGSLLLGVGPSPQGIITPDIIEKLDEIGGWMKSNGKAIYQTRTTENYVDGNTYFIQSKDSKTGYAIHLIQDNNIPDTIEWNGNIPLKGSKIIALATGENVNWKIQNQKLILQIPKKLKKIASPALSFQYKK